MYCIIEYTNYIKLPTINIHFSTKNIHIAIEKAQELCKKNSKADLNNSVVLNINNKRHAKYVYLQNERIIAQYCCYYVKPITKKQIDQLFKLYSYYDTDEDYEYIEYHEKDEAKYDAKYILDDDIENNIKGINQCDENDYILIRDFIPHYSRKEMSEIKKVFDTKYIIAKYNNDKKHYECTDYEKTQSLLKYMILNDTISPLTNMFDKSLIRSQQIYAVVCCTEL